MNKFFASKLSNLLLFVAIPLGAYFINIEVQSYLGRRAFENTGLKNHTLSESMSKAKAEDKLIIVDVSAEWCGACRKLDNEVFANKKVREVVNQKFAFSRLEYNSEEGEEFARKHNVQGTPSLWLVDKDGRALRKLRVTFEPSEFLDQLP